MKVRRDFHSSALWHSPWGSAVVSTPPLNVFLPPVSAPEAVPEHPSPFRQVGVEVVTGMAWGPARLVKPQEALTGAACEPAGAGAARGGFGREGTVNLLRWAPLLVPTEAKAGVWGRGLQWWPCPLHITEQWHPASMVAQAPSTHFSSCGAPYCCPFRLSLHSQQLLPPWVCSPNPTFQHPTPSAPGDTRLRLWCIELCHGPSAWVLLCPACHWPVAAFLSNPSLSQLIFPLGRGLSWVREPLLFFRSPPGVQAPAHFLCSLFISFVLPSYMGSFLVLLGVQGPLLVFSWCSVRAVPFVYIFLMYLWWEANSMSSYSALDSNHSSFNLLNT